VPNDPERAQYQLWIFDAARDDRYPIDGGVFDVPPGRNELIVPMHPTLPVARAVAFAITVEPPGGVVVSNREKVVAFAKAGS
jgi:anti-sigma-K factor RskA